MGNYPAPNFDTLKNSVASDLRDPTYQTFSEPQIGALINEGIGELDRIRPWERFVNLSWTTGSRTLTVDLQTIVSLECQYIQDDPSVWRAVPQCTHTLDGLAADGWDQFGATLLLPPGQWLDQAESFRAFALWERITLVSDSEVAQFNDLTDEQVVRCYARWTALEALLHDRTLYQQWQTQANNSDVSPTQLLQMASTFKQEWTDLRNRARRLRRAV